MMNINQQIRLTVAAVALVSANVSNALPLGDPPTNDYYLDCVDASRATFTATPAQLDRGDSVTLQWSVIPAPGCLWMKQVRIAGQLRSLVGSLTVQPSVTQTFTLQVVAPSPIGPIGIASSPVVVHHPGALDRTFASSGQMIESGSGAGLSTASYADARSLLAGVTSQSGTLQFFVKRLTKTGAPDSTFGSAGKVLIDFPGYLVKRAQILLLPDQKIFLGGTVCIENTNPANPLCEVVAVRLLANGQFDATFGFGGKSIITTSDLHDFGWVSSVVRDATDGGSLVATDKNVVRFKANGGIDTTFGQQGRVVFGPSNVPTWISGIALQSSGKIVVAGADQTNSDSRMGLTRLNRNGSLDTTFGSGGVVSQDLVLNGINGSTLVMAMTLQTDDRIIVGGMGTVFSVYNAALLRRFSKDGVLDTSFEGQERGLQLAGLWWVMALTVQPDNKIFVAGGFGPSTASPSFAVRRLLANGASDVAYGSNGRSLVSGGFYTTQLQVQNFGCLLLAGTRRPTLTSIEQPALVRFEGERTTGQHNTSPCFENLLGTTSTSGTLSTR
jgi:uncharacterized delta-60 repeat protein